MVSVIETHSEKKKIYTITLMKKKSPKDFEK